RPIGPAPHREQLGARLVRRHHRCAEEAERPGVGAGNDQLRLRYPAHRGLDNRRGAAEPLDQNRVERISHQLSPACFLLALAIALASSPAIALPWTRSFWAWAKWCMWNTASIALRLPRSSSTWLIACLVSQLPSRG